MFYGECLRNGRLITERGQFGRLAEKIGLEIFLPERIRFKKSESKA
jgi:hypothetical protein